MYKLLYNSLPFTSRYLGDKGLSIGVWSVAAIKEYAANYCNTKRPKKSVQDRLDKLVRLLS